MYSHKQGRAIVVAASTYSPAATVSATPLRQLRLLIDEMDDLMPTLRATGISTPDTSYAHAFMSLAEGLKQEGWRAERFREATEVGPELGTGQRPVYPSSFAVQ